MMRRYLILISAVVCLFACDSGGDEESEPDAGLEDAGPDAAHHSDADAQSDGDADIGGVADANQTDERVDLDGNPCELYDEHGPFNVGVRDVALDDGTPLAVFYPADESATAVDAGYDMRDFLPEDDRDKISDEDAPRFEIEAVTEADVSADGPFPLILFSHGLAGYRYQSSTLLAHLASWGFVVASAEHEERNLSHILTNTTPDDDNAPQKMRDIIAYLETEIADSSSPLVDLVDMSSIAATGHSMGGNAAVSMVGEPGVEAVLFYASNPDVDDEAQVASFWQGGTNDDLISMNQIRNRYESGPPPKRLLGIEQAGHLAFSDICAIGAEDGGVLEIAADNGIDVPPLIMTLGRDGCREADLAVEKAWPIIHHYSVAHLRDALAIDPEPVGLEAATVGCFSALTELEWAEQ